MSSAALESPEYALLLSCCRSNFATASPKPIELPPTLDWGRFVKLARFHRVEGLAWNALVQATVPEPARETLSSDARSLAATNLAIARECGELLESFRKAKVRLLFLKGLTVGALAYRTPMLKMAWDIDLLIDEGDLAQAAELLWGRGYSLRLPSKPTQLNSWHGYSKESVWTRDGCLHVELHTRLPDNRRLIPSLDVHSPRQVVEVAPGIALPTLAGDELFAYLAVHGASSAWFRLKWISDFAALVHGRDAGEIPRLYQRSQELGAGRAAGQALLLADKLFDILAPAPQLRDRLSCDRATRLLCNAALDLLISRSSDPTDQPFGTLSIHWTQFLLQRGLGYKLSELWRQCANMLNRSG